MLYHENGGLVGELPIHLAVPTEWVVTLRAFLLEGVPPPAYKDVEKQARDHHSEAGSPTLGAS